MSTTLPLEPPANGHPAASEANAPEQVGSKRRKLVLLLTGLVVLVAVIVAGLAYLTRDTRLADASQECRTGGAVSLEDDGDTLVLDGDGSNQEQNFAAIDCLYKSLDIPRSMQTEMGQTTSLMGRQTATHEDLDYSWAYHPDNGFDLIVTAEDARELQRQANALAEAVSDPSLKAGLKEFGETILSRQKS